MQGVPRETGGQAAASPGQHLPRRVRALAEEEVRRERGEGADREPTPRPERDAGRRDDHRHRLHARNRREEHAARGGEPAEGRDEREVLDGARPALEPGGAGDEHCDARQED